MPKDQAKNIPPFNPFKLYANTTPLEGNDRPDSTPGADVRLLELNGILPNEDGQELEAQEVAALVAEAVEEASDAAGGEILAERAQRAEALQVPQTTSLAKTTFERSATVMGASTRRAGKIETLYFENEGLPRALRELVGIAKARLEATNR